MSQASPTPVRDEIRANLKLALPLIAAQLAGVGMNAIDTVFAGQLGPQPLAAVAIGTNFNVIFLVFFLGLFMACSALVAHMAGSGRAAADVGVFIRRTRRMAWVGGVLWVLLLNLMVEPAVRGLKLTPETARQTVAFVRTLSGSGFGMCLWFALRFCAEGLGQVRPVFYSGLVGLGCNAVIDWLLLFGHFGLPRFGAPGCGIATTLSSLAMAGVLEWHFRRGTAHGAPVAAATPARQAEWAAALAATGEGVRDILRIGVPIGLVVLAEAGLFVLAAMLMAQFGDTTVAAFQVALNFAAVMFMIPMGVALATTVRVGHAAGAGDAVAARFRGFVGMGLGAGNAGSNAAIMALFGGFIARCYTQDPGIAAEAAYFLLLAAAFQLFDGLQVTANGALRGIKDTRLPLLITMVSYWVVGLSVAWWLAFRVGMGPTGLWWGLTAGLGMAAIGLSLRYRQQTGRALAANRSELMA